MQHPTIGYSSTHHFDAASKPTARAARFLVSHSNNVNRVELVFPICGDASSDLAGRLSLSLIAPPMTQNAATVDARGPKRVNLGPGGKHATTRWRYSSFRRSLKPDVSTDVVTADSNIAGDSGYQRALMRAFKR